jgi:hypothetical protein
VIKALIELELVYPYKKSMATLADFCTLWECGLLGGGTNRAIAKISMPSKHFKKIFGMNPSIKDYDIPRGAEKFTTGKWKVKKILM